MAEDMDRAGLRAEAEAMAGRLARDDAAAGDAAALLKRLRDVREYEVALRIGDLLSRAEARPHANGHAAVAAGSILPQSDG